MSRSRIASALIVSTLLVAPVAAQEAAQEPAGNLAEVMRGILFPNSNLLFDVQTQDPNSAPESNDRSTTTGMFSGIYKGWQVVQQAAIALAEAERLITVPGRKCEDGREAPVANEDFKRFAKEMTVAANKTYAAAKAENRDLVIELTNDVAASCENCHDVYRRYQMRCRK